MRTWGIDELFTDENYQPISNQYECFLHTWTSTSTFLLLLLLVLLFILLIYLQHGHKDTKALEEALDNVALATRCEARQVDKLY